jgi:predicted transcriptional regulator/DNA-binding XRE family transcriptional regulator
MVEEEYIRLIFGLKMKQIRNEKDLSLFGLSKKTGLSKSYLNEIEKGKKYPKRDKILLIAEALETSYDHLVSLKLDKNLAPVGEILQSRLLKEIPLDLFGIRESDLIDIIAEAPVKVNAFISTLIEIAKHYNLGRESFFLAALRSYQEAQNNYFDGLEKNAELFAKAYNINLDEKINPKELQDILTEEYGYTINTDALSQHNELTSLRSVFVPSSKTLLLSDGIDESQKTFIYAKEIAYNYLGIQDRLYTFSWIKFDTFDQVLNNFYASYFAGALIIPRHNLVSKLKHFFAQDSWKPQLLLEMMTSFTDSPETFYQRLTNILPRDFNMRNIFFLRFSHSPEQDAFRMEKELHITNLQEPHANDNNEHYCRRWVGMRTLKQIAASKSKVAFGAQISEYVHTDNEYLVLSSSMEDPFMAGKYRSIALGILHNKELQAKVPFLKQSPIPRMLVGVTCETCDILNCEVRAAAPVRLQKRLQNKKTEDVVKELTAKFS